jgi:aldehyde:ferredoxin oxidoreductase
MNGYAGTVLRVNLSERKVTKQPYPSLVAERFLGGRGLGIYTLYTEVPKGADPLGPENKLIASTGPLSGLYVPGAGKMDWATKSPQTGGYASSSVGGMLTAELKCAGYDAIILEGMADRPLYLFIDDDTVELREADEYWDMGCISGEEALKGDLGEEFQIAIVGPAAGKGVKYASIGHDFGRQAGRGGVGTVMGGKKLKAIAVRGTKDIPVADPAALFRQGQAVFDACLASHGLKAWQRYGTTIVTEWCDENGTLPTRNFQAGAFEQGANLYGEVMRQTIVITDKGCFACPSPCGKYSHSKKHSLRVEGPEYETIAMLGSNVAMADIEDVAKANYMCDELGIDTISAGNAIAFAIECYQRGIISKKETGGLELDWGDSGQVFTLIEKIANREGIGAVLAEGVKHAARVFGGNSADFAVHVKGMEQSGYDTHDATAMLLAYMTADVGAHHNRAWAITYDIEVGRDKVAPEKVARTIYLQHIRPLFDNLGSCRLQWVELGIEPNPYASALEAATGVKRSWDDLLHISERTWNLTRMYWVREVDGFGRDWDAPPRRFCKDPATYGPTEGRLTTWESAQEMLGMYYEQRGWDSNGIPTRQKLAALDLLDIVGA